MSRKRALALFCAVIALVGTGCEDEDEPDQGVGTSVSVQASDFRFDPTTVPVEIGSRVTVELENIGTVLHSFTIPDLDVEVETEGGQTASVTFTAPDTAGTFEFICKYHPNEMTGALAIGGTEGEVGDPNESETPDDDDDDVEDEEDEEDTDVDVDVDVDE